MTIAEQGNISIHTENIFPIIKKWLYSDHEIFLRELISNAVDAIQKMRMVSMAGDYSGEAPEPEIIIAVEKETGQLSITDNGIGMTADEVKKYINQVAFSSAEEFVEKYKSDGDQAIIGHFGLGFYSAFMVANTVEIETLSYKADAEAVHWSCEGSTTFNLKSGDRTAIGTKITLTLLEEEKGYLEDVRIRQLVKDYCDFMPVPIKMEATTTTEGEEGEEATVTTALEQINQQVAPWKESPSNLTDEQYLEFYRYLYPFQEEPLLWVHINTDYPFIVNGILYFPKLKPDIDVTKGQIKLFCNQVFVSDNCEEVVPQFLLPLRGVLDSSDIPLNVSRSFLQADRTVKQIANHVAKKVGDRLKELYRDDRAKYISSWQDLGTFVKFGSINDDKFKKQIEDYVIFRTTAKLDVDVAESGDETKDDAWSEENKATDSYCTIKEYLERNKDSHENKVYYCTEEATQSTYVELLKSQGIEVLFMDTFIDQHFVPFLEREYSDVKFLRVDSELDETLIDKEKEAEVVDPNTNQTRSDMIKDLFEKSLEKQGLTVRIEALKGEGSPPAMVLLPESARRMQEMMAMMQNQSVQFPVEHTLMVNTSHPMIQNLVNLNQGAVVTGTGDSPSATLSKQICEYVYDLALMAQKGFDADGMKSFTERSNQMLTKLTELAIK